MKNSLTQMIERLRDGIDVVIEYNKDGEKREVVFGYRTDQKGTHFLLNPTYIDARYEVNMKILDGLLDGSIDGEQYTLDRVTKKIQEIAKERIKKAPRFQYSDIVDDLIKYVKKHRNKLIEYANIPILIHDRKEFNKKLLSERNLERIKTPGAEEILLVFGMLELILDYKNSYPVLKAPRDILYSTELITRFKEFRDLEGNIFNLEDLQKLPNRWPSSWKNDEFTLFFDYIFREYRKKKRDKIVVAFHVSEKILSRYEEEYIIITLPRLVKTLDISYDQARKLIAPPTKPSALARILNTEFIVPALIRIGNTEKEVGKKLWIIRPSEGFYVDRSEVNFYELNTIIFEVEKNHTFIEANTFARIKKEFPSKTQTPASRLMAHIMAKSSNAILSLEEVAELTGQKSKLRIRAKSEIIKNATEILDLLKSKGLINAYRWEKYTLIVTYELDGMLPKVPDQKLGE